MNAPDKIFILNHKDYSDRRILNAFTEKDNDTDIEYISKDALLEWLQKEYDTISWYHEKMQHVTGCIGDTDSSGKAEAYKEVIEKINAM